MNQPVVHPLDGTRKGPDPSWFAVTLPSRQKKKTSSSQGTWTGRVTSLGIMNQLVYGCPPAFLRCHVRAPEPAGPYHPPLTPALGAFIGPKQCNTMTFMAMALTAGTCHWVSTAPDGISGTTDEVFSSRPLGLSRQSSAPTSLLIEEFRWDSMQLTWIPPCPKVFASISSTHGRNLPLCKFESRWTGTTRTANLRGLTVSPVSIWVHAHQLFLLFLFCGASGTVDAKGFVLCSICSCSELRLLSPPPFGGEGLSTKKKKKKKTVTTSRVKWLCTR